MTIAVGRSKFMFHFMIHPSDAYDLFHSYPNDLFHPVAITDVCDT